MIVLKCEWCDMSYPKGLYPYYIIYVYDTHHVICKDCYDQLKEI